MNFHAVVNTLEAIFWAGIGCVFIWQSLRAKDKPIRTRCRIAAVAFLLFGGSDAVEITTGAWWRPWWLLLWKAVCLICLVSLYLEFRLLRSPKPEN